MSKHFLIWLNILFYLQSGMIFLSILELTCENITWMYVFISLLIVVVYWRLSSYNNHYKKVAMFRGMLILGEMFFMITSSKPLSLHLSVFALAATYEEYCGHKEILLENNYKLAHKWHILLCWYFGANLFVVLMSLILSLSLHEMENLSYLIVIQIEAIIRIIIGLIYLLLLFKTIKSLEFPQ